MTQILRHREAGGRGDLVVGEIASLPRSDAGVTVIPANAGIQASRLLFALDPGFHRGDKGGP